MKLKIERVTGSDKLDSHKAIDAHFVRKIWWIMIGSWKCLYTQICTHTCFSEWDPMKPKLPEWAILFIIYNNFKGINYLINNDALIKSVSKTDLCKHKQRKTNKQKCTINIQYVCLNSIVIMYN